MPTADDHGRQRIIALCTQAERLQRDGEPEEAVRVVRQAIHLLRLEFPVNPAAGPLLSAMLNLLSTELSRLGHRDDALEAAQDSVRVCRNLTDIGDIERTSLLGVALNNLGIALCDAGRYADALQATEEEVDLGRRLVAANRAAYLPSLAGSLNNLGSRLHDLSRTIRRVRGEPDMEDLYKLHRPWEAVRAYREAIELWREAATSNRSASLPELAKCLENLAQSLDFLGGREKALEAAQEVVELYRELVAVDRDKYQAELVTSLETANRMRR